MRAGATALDMTAIREPQKTIDPVRLDADERAEMARAAEHLGFDSVGAYLRHLHRHAQAEAVAASDKTDYPADGIRTFHETSLGRMLHGDARSYLFREASAQSVDLIMTSPPFGLVRKKTYGNEDAHRYCTWFRPFAEGFRRVLKESGSLVIDIGGAWKPGTPTRSLYHFELLLMLCEDYGFHLCQEHYWWNPAKLPTPAEWVNVRRVRVKDAVNCIWWLSPTPWPKANNRRVLAPYSAAMRDLLKNGYQAKLRPSGHQISDKFSKDNGGSVPPNLLAVANTESNGRYQDYCRRHGLPIHPARFPNELPEYFIRLLTDPGDRVLDPFAGSCVTGAAAEQLGRCWTCCEQNESYLKGAMSRFQDEGGSSSKTADLFLGGKATPVGKKSFYTINPPCSLPVDETSVALVQDGGLNRPPVAARRNRKAE